MITQEQFYKMYTNSRQTSIHTERLVGAACSLKMCAIYDMRAMILVSQVFSQNSMFNYYKRNMKLYFRLVIVQLHLVIPNYSLKPHLVCCKCFFYVKYTRQVLQILRKYNWLVLHLPSTSTCDVGQCKNSHLQECHIFILHDNVRQKIWSMPKRET